MWKKLLLSILFVLSASPALFAGPALDEYLDVRQPDGTTFKARKRGDEFQHWTETESGHTVVRNPKTREWEYATQNPDGTLKPSGQKVLPDQPAPADMPKHLKPPRDTAAEKNQSRSLQEIYLQRVSGTSAQSANKPRDTASYAAGDWIPQPLSGTRKIIMILVNFNDQSLSTTANGWYNSVFSTTAGVKSVANFYKNGSFSTLSVAPVPHSQAGNPAGVVTVSIPHPHPDNGTTESTWVAAAINAANSFVNFASLDANANGYIDRDEAVVYLIPAGYEESGSDRTPSVWAHATRYTSGGLSAAGKLFPVYAMNGELNDASVQHPLGVIVHEMGHQFCGLPDLYDTSNSNEGMGYFSVMASGSWGADVGEDSGSTPTNLDAWSREYLGWAAPVTPTAATTMSLAQPLSSQSAAYKLISPLVSSTEYFMVENRQPTGWDLGLRGKSGFGSGWAGGLLITHIDITAGTVGSNDINNYSANGGRQGVVPVQASTAACDMLSVGASCRGNATTLYYSSNNASWTPSTTPNSNYYNGTATNFSLLGISAQAATMTANLTFTPPVAIALPAAIDNAGWTVTTGGAGNWSGQSSTTHDGVDAAKSATITDSQSSWMQTTLTAAGTLSFWWKVSSESCCDKLRFYVDGVEQTTAIGGDVDWTQVTGIAIPAGTHTIKWSYDKDGSVSSGSDAGWVDQVVLSAPTPTVQLQDAIDNGGWTVTTGGDGSWTGQTATSHDGTDAAQSAAIADSQSSWMQTTVAGSGQLSFWWKVSSESCCDKLKLYVDDVEQAAISGSVDWTQVTGIAIPAGSHTIKWSYGKDGSVSTGSDAGWVDQVAFTSGYLLTVTRAGVGGGTVTASPGTLSWSGATGTALYSPGTVVTLTAQATAGSIFAGWSGACSGTAPTATVTMSAAKSCTATFNGPRILLLDNSLGEMGTALTQIGYAYTPMDATAFASANLSSYDVIMTAWMLPAANATALVQRKAAIASWTAAGGRIFTSSAVTPDASGVNDWSWLPLGVTPLHTGHNNDVSVVATNHALMTTPHLLDSTSMSNWGNSYHNVWSSYDPAFELIAQNSSSQALILAASYGNGMIVVSGSDPEYHTINGPAAGRYYLENLLTWGGYNSSGRIAGSVTSSAGGAPLAGVQVTATGASTATAVTGTDGSYSINYLSPGSYTVTFTRDGYLTGTTSGVTVTSGATVTASKALTPSAHPLTVAFAGTGGGSVNSISPASPTINCTSGSTCAPVSFAAGTSVTLSALADSSSSFNGWSTTPACSGTGNCVVAMTAPRSVTATFTLVPMVKIQETDIAYPTVQAAYNAAATGNSILVRVTSTPFDSLLLNRAGAGIEVTIRGGLDQAFSTPTGYSEIGPLTVATGGLTIDRVVIK